MVLHFLHGSSKLMRLMFQIVAHLGIANFSASSRRIDRFKKRHSIVYRAVAGKSRCVNPETVEDWKND
jgi:hypothetical protein